MNILRLLIFLFVNSLNYTLLSEITYTSPQGNDTETTDTYALSSDPLSTEVSTVSSTQFQIERRVAIIIHPSGMNYTLPPPYFEKAPTFVLTGEGHSATVDIRPRDFYYYPNVSTNMNELTGALYANTDITLSFNATDFVHESDAGSTFKPHVKINILGKNSIFGWEVEDDNDSSGTPLLPYERDISTSELASSENQIGFDFLAGVFLDTLDISDRVGTYTSVVTISITTP